ncbi:CRISPR-associated helicase/endonuclease Cas3 [Nocardiopsis listeri]|uniref:CRISPR-associated helicase/endonuclease Cas3 n=1 Tax=Nocardiopsis listeri TaxID=53440 RepID=UPI000A038DD6|nr:CRISPR-associated helicase/endonuclease Cas3 [Nocardiopsis listeri]
MTEVPPTHPSYIDLRIWAKERGLRGMRYPYACHALDATAATLVLWDRALSPGLKARISHGLGTDHAHARSLAGFWAGCHDTGKLIREFQEQIPMDLSSYPHTPRQADRTGHAFVTYEWLTTALPRLDYSDDGYLLSLIAQLLGGHHGTYPSPLDDFQPPAFDKGAWEEQRERTMFLVHEAAGSPPPPEQLEPPVAALLCGLVILSDWLVSQEHFLLAQLATPPVDGSVPTLLGHFRRSLEPIGELVRAAGLHRLTTSPVSFTDSFPGFTPNGLQASLARHLPDLCEEGGLVLITAQPGVGKTEAAFHAADLLGAATGHDGRFVALPTMATADHMYTRLRKYAEHRADVAAPLTLLHSMAWLNPDYVPSDQPVSPVLSKDLEPTDWLMGSKRGLLASWSVGTIDQALMAALPTRHNSLRMFGLAGKVVVIDEVHAVDPYMQTLLERLLHWLGVFGVPVVLLSATLHHSMANALVKAYLTGSRGRWRKSYPAPVPEIHYPGWLHVHPRTGTVTTNPEPFPTTEQPPLEIDLIPVPVVKGAPERAAALRNLLAPLIAEGGCAAVICTTVAESQRTRDLLAAWFDELDSPPELHLLHSRFPQEQRTEITQRLTEALGKDGPANGTRPRRCVVVATQVIEQSLDLDLDLLVSDLAPVGLLLQRAGRCWRHEHLGRVARPTWSSGPRMAVLVPEERESRGHVPMSWQYVYPLSLLLRTHTLLERRAGEKVRVPEDVQRLVDDLYDDETLIEDVEADVRRLGEELALRTHGRNVVVPTSRELGSDLYPLTSSDLELGDHYLATRFGADSVRVLCCFRDVQGELWLDPELRRPLPEPDGEGRMSRKNLAAVIARTIPMRADHSTQPPLEEANRVPESWSQVFHLRDLVLLIHRVTPEGEVEPARLGERHLFLSPLNGLEERR